MLNVMCYVHCTLHETWNIRVYHINHIDPVACWRWRNVSRILYTMRTLFCSQAFIYIERKRIERLLALWADSVFYLWLNSRGIEEPGSLDDNSCLFIRKSSITSEERSERKNERLQIIWTCVWVCLCICLILLRNVKREYVLHHVRSIDSDLY